MRPWRWLALHQARYGLWAGVALGLLMPVVAQVDDVALAAVMLALVGGVGGAMVVPLNALLQHRGATLLSAGRSIAVQGFNENLSVLGMLAAYATCEAAGVPDWGDVERAGCAGCSFDTGVDLR